MGAKLATTRSETTVKHFYDCPCCTTGKFSYGHLRDSPHGMNVTWACKECGAVINATASAGEPDKIMVRDTGRIEKSYDTLILLRYSASTSEAPFYIIVKDKWYPASSPALGEGDVYLYDEHHCPWNYLQRPTLFDGDNDYHGLFEHVKTVLAPTLERALEIDHTFNQEINADTDWLRWANHLQQDQWDALFFPGVPQALQHIGA